MRRELRHTFLRLGIDWTIKNWAYIRQTYCWRPPPQKKCLTHQFKTCRIYQIRSLINTKNNVTCKATENLPWTLTHHLSEGTNCPQTTITCPLVIGTKIWQTECQLTQYLKSLTKLSCCCSRPQISLIRFSSNLIKCSSEHLERQFWQVKL